MTRPALKNLRLTCVLLDPSNLCTRPLARASLEDGFAAELLDEMVDLGAALPTASSSFFVKPDDAKR